jgi:hypothetical protein
MDSINQLEEPVQFARVQASKGANMSDDALIEAMAREFEEMSGSALDVQLRAALAAIRKTHAVVPRDAGADAFAPGVYAAADVLCASEYVNAPDASFVLSLAHRAFSDGYSAVLAASEPDGVATTDPTNPFAPRERPKKSIRLMTDVERRAAGLDPNGGFDGPTGAD